MMIYSQDKTIALDPERFRFATIDPDTVLDKYHVFVYEKNTGRKVEMGVFTIEKEAQAYFEELVKWLGAEGRKCEGQEIYTSRTLEFLQPVVGEFEGRVTVHNNITWSEGGKAR